MALAQPLALRRPRVGQATPGSLLRHCLLRSQPDAKGHTGSALLLCDPLRSKTGYEQGWRRAGQWGSLGTESSIWESENVLECVGQGGGEWILFLHCPFRNNSNGKFSHEC